LLNFKTLAFLALITLIDRDAGAQAVPTADRLGDLQIGINFSVANPDYSNDVYHLSQPTDGSLRWHGYGAYADFDFRYHYGIEVDFHQLSGPDPNLYERTYEIGGRYLHPIRNRFVPYGKLLVGRGVFNFAALDSSGQSVQIANLAYNTLSAGGGLDMRVLPGLNIRVFDYEYQHWLNFPPDKLNPQVLSFGVAYHFHGPMKLRQ